MISALPNDIKWYRVKIHKKDLEKVYHCPTDDWRKISNMSYHPYETAIRVFSDLDAAFDNQADLIRAKKIRAISSGLLDSSSFNGLIIIGRDTSSAVTILEGNHRLTAIYNNLIKSNDETLIAETAYLGIHENMNTYPFHFGTYNPDV